MKYIYLVKWRWGKKGFSSEKSNKELKVGDTFVKTVAWLPVDPKSLAAIKKVVREDRLNFIRKLSN